MKNSVCIALFALFVSMLGLAVAIAAYLNSKESLLDKAFDDDLIIEEPDDIEYYSADIIPETEHGNIDPVQVEEQ